MKELSDALNKAESDPSGAALIELDEAGRKWGAYCLKAFRGKLRRRGLDISAAISDFHDELIPSAARERAR